MPKEPKGKELTYPVSPLKSVDAPASEAEQKATYKGSNSAITEDGALFRESASGTVNIPSTEPEQRVTYRGTVSKPVNVPGAEPEQNITYQKVESKTVAVPQGEKESSLTFKANQSGTVNIPSDEQERALTFTPKSAKEIQIPNNEPLQKGVIKLSGKLITGDPVVAIGENFRTLTNMRYGDVAPEAIFGMEAIGSLAWDSEYPTHDTDHVKATDKFSTDYWPYYATDPSKSLTGTSAGNAWASPSNGANPPNPQRFHIDLGSAKTITRIYYENYHSSGASTDYGAQNFTFWGSNEASAFAELTYATDTDWTQLTTSESTFKEHAASDREDPQYIDVTNAVAYQYYAFKFADNYLNLGVIGVRRIELQAGETWATADYTKSRRAFHFRRPSPEITESHILSQRWNDDVDESAVYVNDTPPPGIGVYATKLWDDTAGAGVGRFSEAPNDSVAYCNGKEVCLWKGDESKVAAVITSTAAVVDSATDPRIVTDIMNNSKTTEGNTIMLGEGGNDADTILLLHCEGADATTTFTDSSAIGHTVTSNNGACLDSDQAKFGYCSGYFDGTNDYLSVPDDDGVNDYWYMGTDPFTIDFWVRFESFPAEGAADGLFSQRDAADNLACGTIATSGGSHYIVFNILTPGGSDVYMASAATTFSTGQWYHIAFIRNWGSSANAWMITINGTASGSGTTDADPWPDLAADLYIGRFDTGYFNGWIDEFRVSKGIARWTANFTPPTMRYESGSSYWLVGTTLPPQGHRYYIQAANISASTIAVSTWNGSSWQTITATDGTSPSTISMAETGWVTFTSTVGLAKKKYLEGHLLYWCQYSLSAGGALVSQITTDLPFQQIEDLWDGIDRKVGAFVKVTDVDTDYTTNVYNDDYNSDYKDTYADLSGLADTEYVEIGFFDIPTAINVIVAEDSTNTNAAVLSMDFWDGLQYREIQNGLSDGTSAGGKSLAQSGIISFTPPTYAEAFKKVHLTRGTVRTATTTTVTGGINDASIDIATSTKVIGADGGAYIQTPLYYVRLKWGAALSATTFITHVTGIPASNEISGYRFPVFAQDRLMLACDEYGERNKVLVSSVDTSQVFNGEDSFTVHFGGPEALTCGCSLFSLYGSSLYSMTMFFKEREVWAFVQYEEGWKKYKISDIGCPMPLTLDVATVPPQPGEQGNRSFAIWSTATGVYVSDGRHPIEVSHDIRDKFDQNSSYHIDLNLMSEAQGRVDQAKSEYHLFVWMTNDVTATLREYVLDMRRWKWFEIDRTTTKKLVGAFSVLNEYGAPYLYGYCDDGYDYLTESGDDFDGEAMVTTLRTGAMALGDSMFSEIKMRAFIPVLVSQSVAENMTLKHYVNEYTTATSYTVAMAKTNYTITFPVKTANATPGVFHSIEFTASDGFKPFVVGYYYQNIREHDYE